MDILLSFSRRLQLPNNSNILDTQLRDAILKCQGLSKERKRQIETAAAQLFAELDTWRQRFENDIGESSQSCASGGERIFPTSVIWPLNYYDTLTAGTVALYNAACLILQSVFLTLSLSKFPSFCKSICSVSSDQVSISLHSSAILDAGAYLMGTDGLCGDARRAMFSLRIVLLLGLEDEKRQQARLMIEKCASCSYKTHGNGVSVWEFEHEA